MESLVRSDYTWPDLAPPSKAVHLLQSYEAIRESLCIAPGQETELTEGNASSECGQYLVSKPNTQRSEHKGDGTVDQRTLEPQESSQNSKTLDGRRSPSRLEERAWLFARLPRQESPACTVRREIFPQVQNSDDIVSGNMESIDNLVSGALSERVVEDDPQNDTTISGCSRERRASSEDGHAMHTTRKIISDRSPSNHIGESSVAEPQGGPRRISGEATISLSSRVFTSRSLPDPACTTWSWNAGDSTRRQHSCTVVACVDQSNRNSRACPTRGPVRSSSTGISRRRRWDWVENNPVNQEMRRQALERVRKRLEESRRRQIIKQQQQEQFDQERKMRGMILSERLRQRTRERIQEYLLKKQEEQLQREQIELEKRRQAEHQRLLCDMHRRRLQKRLAEQQRICKQAMRRQIEDSMKFSYDMKVSKILCL